MFGRVSAEMKVDEKSRITIPSRMRQGLGSPVIITRGPGECLYMMSEEVWVNCFEEDLQDAEMNDDDLSQVARYFKSALDELIPDQQGRVVINPMLKAHAKFDKGAEVILIPMAQHIEIWAKQVASSEFTSMDAKTLKNIMATRGIGGRKRELSV